MQTVSERNVVKSPAFNGRLAKKNGEPHGIRWTVDEYYQMYELGLFYGRRVELIKGEIFEMSPMLSPHATSIQLVLRVLLGIFDKGFVVRPQMPMSFSKIDEPEPDVAVVKGSIRGFTEAHPTTAVLLVEVALTSLRFDRTKKLRLYAENRIQDYWIVNLKQRRLEVFRQPITVESGGFDYAEKLVLSEGQFICPLEKPDARIKVADLLP